MFWIHCCFWIYSEQKTYWWCRTRQKHKSMPIRNFLSPSEGESYLTMIAADVECNVEGNAVFNQSLLQQQWIDFAIYFQLYPEHRWEHMVVEAGSTKDVRSKAKLLLSWNTRPLLNNNQSSKCIWQSVFVCSQCITFGTPWTKKITFC